MKTVAMSISTVLFLITLGGLMGIEFSFASTSQSVIQQSKDV